MKKKIKRAYKQYLKNYMRNGKYFFGAFFSGVFLFYLFSKTVDLPVSVVEEEYESLADLSEEEERILVSHYQNYVNGVALEICEVGLNEDPISAFGCYVALQNSGAISYEDFFGKLPSFEIKDYDGFSVVLGNGVCRNQSDNLYRILKRLGYDCGLVYGTLEKETNNDTSELNDNDTIVGHVAVYVKEEDGTIFLLDPVYQTIYIHDDQTSWISATNEENSFKVWKELDAFRGLNNEDVYKYRGNELSHRITWGTKCTRALSVGKEYIDFYQEYEKNYLLYTESEIAYQVDEYYKAKEREKILKNAGYKFNEKGE